MPQPIIRRPVLKPRCVSTSIRRSISNPRPVSNPIRRVNTRLQPISCPICGQVISNEYLMEEHQVRPRCFHSNLMQEIRRKKYPILIKLYYRDAVKCVNVWLMKRKLDYHKLNLLFETGPLPRRQKISQKILYKAVLWNLNYSKMNKIYFENNRTALERMYTESLTSIKKYNSHVGFATCEPMPEKAPIQKTYIKQLLCPRCSGEYTNTLSREERIRISTEALARRKYTKSVGLF